jgi:KEOPS complex subunit Cgi121
MEVVEGRATVEDVDGFVATLGRIGEEYGTTVQAFDARYVVNREHLERAVELASRARERGEAVAEDPAVEILLYAAGRRQITDALAMGVSAGAPLVAVVVGGEEAAAARAVADRLDTAATLGEYDPERVREFFGVDDRELAATEGDLADIVLERVALLTVNR